MRADTIAVDFGAARVQSTRVAATPSQRRARVRSASETTARSRRALGLPGRAGARGRPAAAFGRIGLTVPAAPGEVNPLRGWYDSPRRRSTGVFLPSAERCGYAVGRRKDPLGELVAWGVEVRASDEMSEIFGDNSVPRIRIARAPANRLGSSA